MFDDSYSSFDTISALDGQRERERERDREAEMIYQYYAVSMLMSDKNCNNN